MSPAKAARASGLGDVVVGSQFFATHQLRTPLRMLVHRGEVHRDMHTPPPVIVSEEWQGAWSMLGTTWREIGVDMDEMPSTCASDIGLVCSNEYLPFLIAARSVVEADGPATLRRERLRQELLHASWAAFVHRLGGSDAVLDRFFPPFVATIKGLPQEAISSLQSKGLRTPSALLATADVELLAIRGIGTAKLKGVREACAGAKDKSSEFQDWVVR